jgi:hypothetical protein
MNTVEWINKLKFNNQASKKKRKRPKICNNIWLVTI